MFLCEKRLFSFAICLCYIQSTLSIQNKWMFIERQKSFDQDKSASGYVYRSDVDNPAPYVRVGGHHGISQAALRQAPAQQYGLVAPAVVPLGQYVTHAQYVAAPQPVYIESIPYTKTNTEHYAPNNPTINVAAPLIEGSEVEDSHYKKGGGENHNQAEYAEHGEKGDKGYKSNHGYEKGAQGKHDHEGHKGHYASNGGRQAGYADKTGYYSGRQAEAHGAKGEKFYKSDGHKKGSKTTGFHNVYHKDEYKKDHTFYDETDKKGFHEKYGNGHAQHDAHSGGYKKGGNAHSGYHADHHGKKGYHDKGHFLDQAKGYKGQHGDEAYYANDESYKKNSGHKDGSEYGYQEEAPAKYHY